MLVGAGAEVTVLSPVSISALLLFVRFRVVAEASFSAVAGVTAISVPSSSPSGHGSDQPPGLVNGMRQETGEDLHHPAEKAACRQRQRRPARYVRIVARQLGVCGSDAELLLSCAPLLPIYVPAIAECARAAVR